VTEILLELCHEGGVHERDEEACPLPYFARCCECKRIGPVTEFSSKVEEVEAIALR